MPITLLEAAEKSFGIFHYFLDKTFLYAIVAGMKLRHGITSQINFRQGGHKARSSSLCRVATPLPVSLFI